MPAGFRGQTARGAEEAPTVTRRETRTEPSFEAHVKPKLVEAGHSIEEIAAAAGLRYEAVLAIVELR
jgi:hypothetical protein